MKKKNIIISGIAILILLAGFAYWKYIFSNNNFYAVYLNTGDVYFGKLSKFPNLKLHNAWFLKKDGDQSQPFSLAEFKNAFWSPQGDLELNEENVIWMAKINNDSQVVQLMKGEVLQNQNLNSNLEIPDQNQIQNP